MNTIDSYFSYSRDPRTYADAKSVVSNELIGVELEYELIRETPGLIDERGLWEITIDESLRVLPGFQSLEFRFRQPLSGKDLITALRAMQKYLKDLPRGEGRCSERTGAHVHLDIRNLTTPQLATLISTCRVMDPFLFEYAGRERANNFYCVPMRDTLTEHISIIHACADPTLFQQHMEFNKYSSINVNPITEYGSIEFRHMPATRSMRRMLEWINMLLRIKQFAMTFDGNFDQYFKQVSGSRPSNIVRDILGPQSNLVLGDLTPQEADDMALESIRAAQDLVHALSMNAVSRTYTIAHPDSPLYAPIFKPASVKEASPEGNFYSKVIV